VLQLVGNDSALASLDTVAITVSQNFTLSLSSEGSGTVTLDPPGGVYEAGSTVTLTAVPATGFLFDAWSADASGTTNPLTIEMDGPYSVHAHFKSTGGGGGACGIGPELVALLPALGWLLRRRRQRA
jgi:hypothetical protein